MSASLGEVWIALSGLTDCVYPALYNNFTFHKSINVCVHCCGLQMSHITFSFQLLSLSYRFEPCSPVSYIVDTCSSFVSLLFSAEYHNALMCFSLCGMHNTSFWCSRCCIIVVFFTPIFCSTSTIQLDLKASVVTRLRACVHVAYVHVDRGCVCIVHGWSEK